MQSMCNGAIILTAIGLISIVGSLIAFYHWFDRYLSSNERKVKKR